ncbi:MAG TPA: gamma-glutamyltransferase [Gammaproteobacteria bacterium]|jgi:gamma-glutamyltranspeptidase / glutathione hydrolase|nr:gamma-glutamyltransferase [Gammaproteobacteria bacterium]
MSAKPQKTYTATAALLASLLWLPISLHAQGPAADSTAILRSAVYNHPVVDSQGMVVTQNAIASKVGAQILASGGNAVDAAVATGFALAVALPRAGNIGGGGFMLVYLSEQNQTIAIDYREKAPAAAHRDLYLDANDEIIPDDSRFTHRAAGVPGTVAGLHHALINYGTMAWTDVVAPAIELAKAGIIVSSDLADNLTRAKRRLGKNQASLKKFYKDNESNYQVGDLFQQPDLAQTLERISAEGPKGFYTGRTAELIVADMQAHDGLITIDDLANYQAIEREPVHGNYRGHEIVSMPPPSSGGIHIIQMLNVLENFDLNATGYGSALYINRMAEVMKYAYADRSVHLGDPDFYEVPQEWLLNKTYAKEIAGKIVAGKATPSNEILPGKPDNYESPDTTHFSIMDSKGNAVANTYTLNFSYGSGITIPGTGMLLNNEMDDFSSKPGVANAFGLLGDTANEIQPQKRPLSSMTPTFVFKDGKPWFVTGSPGGSRIISAVLQQIVNVIDFGMNSADSAAQPRIHHQWQPDRLQLEPGFSPDTIHLLEAMGYDVQSVSRTWGAVQNIVSHNGMFFGGADPRRADAGALGPDGLECLNNTVACRLP